MRFGLLQHPDQLFISERKSDPPNNDRDKG